MADTLFSRIHLVLEGEIPLFEMTDCIDRPYILNVVAKSYDYALVMSCLLYLVDGVVICNSSEIDY